MICSSTLLPRPNILDPLVAQLATTEALRRGETTIHYSPLTGEWTEGDSAGLRERRIAEIEGREEVELNERRRDDDDRILDLDQKIREAQADLESHAEQLREIGGLEETSRQVRHRAQLQGKITAARLKIAGYNEHKHQIQARIDHDLDLTRTKYV